MLPWLVAQIGHPLYDRFRFGGRIMRSLRELIEMDHASAAELRQLGNRRLAALLSHAASHVPYYRESFSSAGIQALSAAESLARDRAGFEALPLLPKLDLRERRDALLARDRVRPTMAGRTSGATGRPTSILNDMGSIACHRAAKLRARRWLDVRLGDRWAMVWGRDTSPSRLYRTAIELSENRRMYRVQDLETESQAERTLTELADFSPKLLYGYATGLARISELVQRKHVRLPSVRAVISTAEVLSEPVRRALADTLSAPVGIEYGMSEAQFIAGTCEAGSLHIAEENVLVEILTSDGRPAAPGEIGQIVITDLHGYALPLIRYVTGDAGALLEAPCECGRAHARLDLRLARTCELIDLDARQIHPEVFTLPHDFPYFDRVERFRALRVGDRRFRVDMVLCGVGPDAPVLEAYERSVRDELGADIDLSVRRVEAIPRNVSGKHRYYEDVRDKHRPDN